LFVILETIFYPGMSFYLKPDPNDKPYQAPKVIKQTAPLPPAGGGSGGGGGGGGELTDEELKFMADEIGHDGGSEVDDEDLGVESDSGMTEDIADAYEQFLAEQSKNGGGGK
jgi:hypothetical protein